MPGWMGWGARFDEEGESMERSVGPPEEGEEVCGIKPAVEEFGRLWWGKEKIVKIV